MVGHLPGWRIYSTLVAVKSGVYGGKILYFRIMLDLFAGLLFCSKKSAGGGECFYWLTCEPFLEKMLFLQCLSGKFG